MGSILREFKGLPALHCCWGCNKLHVCELLGEDGLDVGLVVLVMGKIESGGVCADVMVFGRVGSCEVLVFNEDGAVRRGQWGKGETAL